ncbi:MAG: dihydroxyacetone kinase subunit DhaK [Chloroflexota bacterium]
MKKLINNPDDVVREALEGMAAAHPDLLSVDVDSQVVVRKDAPVQGQVGIVSGGGSGHEPMHGGFVGMGMLSAACAGQIFTSPVPDQMYEAAKSVDGGVGVLFMVKNYTGDVMNFDLAAELGQADGVKIQSVVMDDDVAVKDSLYTAGRRGVGGTVLAEKICGARAEEGATLQELSDLCRRVNENVRSMGMALTPCTVPTAGKPSFELGENEIEIGIGIHGEPGRRRTELVSADEITEMLLTPILEDLPFQGGDRVIAFVNSMGGTPLIELYILYRKVATMLRDRGIDIAASLVGPYITSLEMQGASLTLLRADDEIIRLWQAPVCTPALRWGA